MKKLFVLSVVSIFALSSFTSVNKSKALKMEMWRTMCADGSYGGSFYCDCTQSQANQIAHIMCN